MDHRILGGGPAHCSLDRSGSGSKTWTRINQADTFNGSPQFKLWFSPIAGDPTNCELNWSINPSNALDVATPCADCDPCGCTRTGLAPLHDTWDPLIAGGIDETSQVTLSITNLGNSGTIDVRHFLQSAIGCWLQDADCTLAPGLTPCGNELSTSGTDTDTVAFTCLDVSGLRGTYTNTRSQTATDLFHTVTSTLSIA